MTDRMVLRLLKRWTVSLTQTPQSARFGAGSGVISSEAGSGHKVARCRPGCRVVPESESWTEVAVDEGRRGEWSLG